MSLSSSSCIVPIWAVIVVVSYTRRAARQIFAFFSTLPKWKDLGLLHPLFPGASPQELPDVSYQHHYTSYERHSDLLPQISGKVPKMGGSRAPSRKSANRALRRLINQRYESVFWGRWSSKAPVFACFFCEVMTTALMSVGYGSPDICPMISPESFSVIVIFQSSNLNSVMMQLSTLTLVPSVHPSERVPRPRAHMHSNAGFFFLDFLFFSFAFFCWAFFCLKSFLIFKKLQK